MADDQPTLQELAKAKKQLSSAPAGGSSSVSLQELAGLKKNKGPIDQSKHRGFLGSVKHVAGQTVKDLETVALQSPAGLYHLGKGLATDPLGTGEEIVKSTAEDLRHPLRRPGYTLLDVLGIAGGVGAIAGRAAEAGRVAAGSSRLSETLAKAGEAPSTARQLRYAVTHGAPPEARVLKGHGQKVNYGSYSRNPTTRAIQKTVDRLHETFPDTSLPGFRNQAERQKKAIQFGERAHEERLMRALPAEYRQKFKKLPEGMHEAVRLVGNGAPLDVVKAYYERIRDSGGLGTRQMRDVESTLNRLEEARKYVDTENVNGVELAKLRDDAPRELHDFVDETKKLSRMRESAVAEIGYLTDYSKMRRLLGPLNEFMGRDLPEDIAGLNKYAKKLRNLGHTKLADAAEKKAAGQMNLLEPVDEAKVPIVDEAIADRLFYVPYKTTPERRAAQYLPRWKGGPPRAPGTLTHSFQGGIMRHGTGRSNVANLTAESFMEALRFVTLKQHRDRLIAVAQDTPDGIEEGYAVPIRISYKHTTSEADKFADELLSKPGELTESEADAGGFMYDRLRRRFFPKKEEVTPEEVAAGNVKWIDKRLLGGLDQQNPLFSAMENDKFRKILHGVDNINDAVKVATLYLKPAYIFPNVLGNIALSLIQQGFLAPVNLAKAVTAFRRLDKETMERIKSTMGGGLSEVLDPKDFNPVKKVGRFAAQGYGKVVDEPFRFASFLHEARLQGYITPKELRALTHDPKHADDFRQISERANEALIDYERIGPGEQAIMRRLVWFYPWVKGSTRYAFRMATESPVALGATTQAGKKGAETGEEELGPLPPYLEGTFKVGERNGNPLVVNPTSAAILSEPAELGLQIQNLFGVPNKDLSQVENLSPVDQALITLLTAGTGHTGPEKPGQSAASLALDEIIGNNPVTSFVKALTNSNYSRLYPNTTKQQAFARLFATGGLTPRELNQPLANYVTYLETHPHG